MLSFQPASTILSVILIEYVKISRQLKISVYWIYRTSALTATES